MGYLHGQCRTSCQAAEMVSLRWSRIRINVLIIKTEQSIESIKRLSLSSRKNKTSTLSFKSCNDAKGKVKAGKLGAGTDHETGHAPSARVNTNKQRPASISISKMQ